MFDIAPSELMLVAVVALVVIGPKDLPRAMRFVGQWVGRARGVARHFRSGFDEMVRQAELEEMEKSWARENARIMAEHAHAPPPEEADDAHYAAAALPPLHDGVMPDHGITPDEGATPDHRPETPATHPVDHSAASDAAESSARS